MNGMPRGYNLSDRGRRTLIETMTRLNADPEFAAKRSAAATKELKRRHTDPNYNLNLARRKRRNVEGEAVSAAPSESG